jgi:hypothetical protein
MESRSLTFWNRDCHSVTYGPGPPNGSSFVEGGDMPMQATTTAGATSYVTYVAPSADPSIFLIEDDGPACPAAAASGAHHLSRASVSQDTALPTRQDPEP